MIKKYISFTEEFSDEWETVTGDAAFATKYFGEEIERNRYASELLGDTENYSLRVLLLYLLTSGTIHRNDLDEALGAMRVAFSEIDPRNDTMDDFLKYLAKLAERQREAKEGNKKLISKYELLMKYAGQDSAYGDLADDVKRDKSFPVKGSHDWEVVKRHLEWSNASCAALDVADEFWNEIAPIERLEEK